VSPEALIIDRLSDFAGFGHGRLDGLRVDGLVVQFSEEGLDLLRKWNHKFLEVRAIRIVACAGVEVMQHSRNFWRQTSRITEDTRR